MNKVLIGVMTSMVLILASCNGSKIVDIAPPQEEQPARASKPAIGKEPTVHYSSSCDGVDFDGDGTVTSNDMSVLSRNMGGSDSAYDLNGDGAVDYNDLREIVGCMGHEVTPPEEAEVEASEEAEAEASEGPKSVPPPTIERVESPSPRSVRAHITPPLTEHVFHDNLCGSPSELPAMPDGVSRAGATAVKLKADLGFIKNWAREKWDEKTSPANMNIWGIVDTSDPLPRYVHALVHNTRNDEILAALMSEEKIIPYWGTDQNGGLNPRLAAFLSAQKTIQDRLKKGVEGGGVKSGWNASTSYGGGTLLYHNNRLWVRMATGGPNVPPTEGSTIWFLLHDGHWRNLNFDIDKYLAWKNKEREINRQNPIPDPEKIHHKPYDDC